MVCLTCLVADALLPSRSRVKDNGRHTERRMQQSSRGTAPRQAQGNQYTPFPTRSTGSSRPGRVAGTTPVSVSPTSSLVVVMPPQCNGLGGAGAARATDARQLASPLLHTSRPLPTSSAPSLSITSSSSSSSFSSFSSSSSTSSTVAENGTSSDDAGSCRLVTFHPNPPPHDPQPPTSSASLPSETYLYLYKQLPKVTSDVDLDRLGRSMRGLQEGCFYYPDLDSSGARSLLRKAPEGTFLVRDSSDPRYLFSLTVKTGRGATSVRIQYQKGFFQLDCDDHMKRKLPRFETLLDLLDFHVTVCREQQGAQYRWQESSKRMDLVINLSTPRRHSPPSLAHLARVSVNRTLQDLHLPHRSTDLLPVPSAMKQFLRGYPFKV